MDRHQWRTGTRIVARRDAGQHHALLAHGLGSFVRATLLREFRYRLFDAEARPSRRGQRLSRRAISAAENLGRTDLLEALLLERGRKGRALRRFRAAGAIRRRAARFLRQAPLK